jgi:hypothetical protein
VVSEAHREPGGAAFVWLGFGTPAGRWTVEQVPVQGSGETSHASLTTQVLERARRLLDAP